MALASDAQSEDVELDPERKQDILRLEAALDRMNHFEVLGLPPGASEEDAKRAYHQASLRYHPDRYFQKRLGSYRARIERIFKRLSEAHSVLTDPQRRTDYQQTHPEFFPARHPDPPVRLEEEGEPPVPRSEHELKRAAERRERLTRHPYLAKTSRYAQLVARGRASLQKGDYAKANHELQLASTIDSEAKEAKLLLDEARRKDHIARAERENKRAEASEKEGDLRTAATSYAAASELEPHQAHYAAKAALLFKRLGQDLHRARMFAHRAVMLEPANLEYRLCLASLLAAIDLKKAAKVELEEVLKRDPENSDAKKQLRKLRWSF